MRVNEQSRIIGSIEAHSIDWIPDEERHGKVWHQAPLWFLGNFGFLTVTVGFIGPVAGLSMSWTIIAGTTGIVIGTIFMALHGSQGPVFGLPQMIQSRAQFGYRGVIVPLMAALFTYLGLNVADQVLLADGGWRTFGWNRNVTEVAVTVCALLLAIYGHDWVHRVFRAILAVLVPLTAIITVAIIFNQVGYHPSHTGYGFNWFAFMAEFSAAAAYNITYAPYVSDYSRYVPRNASPRLMIASVFCGAAVSAIWLIALGAWLAIRIGSTDGLADLRTAGNSALPLVGSLTAILSVLAMVAAMGMNAYGAMLTALTAVDSFREVKTTRRARMVAIVLLAAAWYVSAALVSANAVSTVLTVLTLMLYLLVPWTATNLMDYFFVRRGHYAITDLFSSAGIYGMWAWRGLASYTLGLACEVPFAVLPNLGGFSYTGVLAKQISGVDISFIVGVIGSSVSYYCLTRGIWTENEAEAIEKSQQTLAEINGV